MYVVYAVVFSSLYEHYKVTLSTVTFQLSPTLHFNCLDSYFVTFETVRLDVRDSYKVTFDEHYISTFEGSRIPTTTVSDYLPTSKKFMI